MKSGWQKLINYELGYDFIFNKIISEANSNKFLDEKGFLNLYITISKKIRLDAQYELYNYGNTNQKSINFLDFKLNYIVDKYKFNLFLQGNNLLNENQLQRYSISNISESLYTQKLLQRNIILGVNKNF